VRLSLPAVCLPAVAVVVYVRSGPRAPLSWLGAATGSQGHTERPQRSEPRAQQGRPKRTTNRSRRHSRAIDHLLAVKVCRVGNEARAIGYGAGLRRAKVLVLERWELALRFMRSLARPARARPDSSTSARKPTAHRLPSSGTQGPPWSQARSPARPSAEMPARGA
jgi:hypothetical protein